MIKVKICGIMRENDIIYLNRYLPDYAGFIFAESRRRLQPETACRLSEGLDGSIVRVGVFVNAGLDDVAGVALKVGLGAVQLHGEETSGYVAMLRSLLKPGTEVWKGIRVRDAASLEGLEGYGADRILLDAFVEGSYGGAGKSFDWKLAKNMSSMILAGGLYPHNVQEAVQMAKPFAVDVSSGVETDGFKNEIKIRDFINNIRQANLNIRNMEV